MFIQILDERTIEGTFNVQTRGKHEENEDFFPINSGFTGNEVTN